MEHLMDRFREEICSRSRHLATEKWVPRPCRKAEEYFSLSDALSRRSMAPRQQTKSSKSSSRNGDTCRGATNWRWDKNEVAFSRATR